jgi:O-Antigen ligase
MLYVEGVALMILATDACGGDRLRRDRLLRMMVLGAATAAFFNVMKILTSAMLQPEPWSKFLVYFATARVNVHFPDLNAAGSYFALMLFVSLGFSARAGGGAAIASVMIFAGLWVAGSRTALAAALVGFGVGVFLMGRGRYRKLLAVVAPLVLVAVAVAAWKLYPQGRNAAGGDAFAFRVLMGKAAVAMISAHPVFGVGPGHFAELSGPYQNNAHNNFLQIGAELGIPAVVLFVIVAWIAVRASWRDAETWGTSRGLSLGLAAFLATCLAGHPLLISGAAYPFWMALGLAAGLDPNPVVSRRVQYAGVIAVAIIAATLPFRMSAAKRNADVEHASVGFSNWQQESDGARYRWAGGHAWFFVAPAARSVRIPMRLGPAAPAVVEIRLFLDGIEANRVVLRQGDDVRTVRLNLLRRATTPFARIDLESRIPGNEKPLDARPTDSGGILRVGRPIFEN